MLPTPETIVSFKLKKRLLIVGEDVEKKMKRIVK